MRTTFNSLSLVICSAVLSSVYGCGPLQAGQEKTINFTVTDFKLPAVMAYSADPDAKMKAPTISTTMSEAEAFVQTLIMRSVEDVLYAQGRSALLSDNVISSILQQLNIQISYKPLNCMKVIDTTGAGAVMNNMVNCIVVDDTVTRICTDAGNVCTMANMVLMISKPIPPENLSISGRLRTSNVVMANWSNLMWQSVLNRVLRKVTSSSIGSFFYGASVIIR